jgi:hypothetical protein
VFYSYHCVLYYCVTNLRKQSLYDYRHFLRLVSTGNLNTFSQEPCCPNVLIQKNSIFQVSYSVPFGITVLSTIYTQALQVIVLARFAYISCFSDPCNGLQLINRFFIQFSTSSPCSQNIPLSSLFLSLFLTLDPHIA